MDISKRKSFIKAIITFQFNYCPRIWIFHNRQLNNQINKISERALTIVMMD